MIVFKEIFGRPACTERGQAGHWACSAPSEWVAEAERQGRRRQFVGSSRRSRVVSFATLIDAWCDLAPPGELCLTIEEIDV